MIGSLETPEVDIVIAVHSLSRPIQRAVHSALAAGKPGQVKVIVVGHGLDPRELWKNIKECPKEFVQVVRHDDGIRSPAGPFNAGLRLAQAEYTAIMGSDDWLEPGSIQAWLTQARKYHADVVLAPLKFQNGTAVRTPRLRPFHKGILDPVRDRLAYRTAPLGLIRRSAVQASHLAFTEGLATGEDITFSLRLWFDEARVVMGQPGFHYVIGEDAQDRVTRQHLPLSQEFRPFFLVLEDPWFLTLSNAQRRSIAVKIVRIHMVPALLGRGDSWAWTGPDGTTVHQLLTVIEKAAPGYASPLSKSERSILAASQDLPKTAALLSHEIQLFSQAQKFERMLTRRFLDNFLIESHVRYFWDLKLAGLAARWTRWRTKASIQ